MERRREGGKWHRVGLAAAAAAVAFERRFNPLGWKTVMTFGIAETNAQRAKTGMERMSWIRARKDLAHQ